MKMDDLINSSLGIASNIGWNNIHKQFEESAMCEMCLGNGPYSQLATFISYSYYPW